MNLTGKKKKKKNWNDLEQWKLDLDHSISTLKFVV